MAFHKYHTYEISPPNSVDKVLFERLVFGGTFPQMLEIPPPEILSRSRSDGILVQC